MSSNESKAPAHARLAATILMLRDGPQGLEVFMVVRHHQIDFASGALVFPGGKLAPGDEDARLLPRLRGHEQLEAAQWAVRVAAIREVFEESGVLLAQARESGQPPTGARLENLGARYRQSLDRGELGMADLLEAEDLLLDLSQLTAFAHWITPEFMPKRFDTYFYLAEVPARQQAGHDGEEAVDSVWIRPADALAQAASGQRTLVPATALNLERLGQCNSVAAAIEAARAAAVVTVLPELVEGSNGSRLRIPPEAGYTPTEFELPASMRP